MKRVVLGTLACIGLVLMAGAFGERGEVFAQRVTPSGVAPVNPGLPASTAAAGNELIVVPTSTGDRGQMLTVVDPRTRVISVYHIDLTGKIELRGVRNISWDLQMMYLNNANPLPQEIRSLLEQK